jgi:Ca2+-binding EF-hand superfamily protein
MRISTETTTSRPYGAKEKVMKRVFSMGVVTLAALALPLSVLADHEEGRDGKRMSKIMSHLDTDENGTISLSEFQMPEGRDAPDMRMDLNGDGTISRDEVTEAASQHSEKALARFDDADLDGNGVITPDERRQVAFNRIDSDADGQLTQSEMRKARKEMGKRMKRHGKKGKDNMHRHDARSEH